MTMGMFTNNYSIIYKILKSKSQNILVIFLSFSAYPSNRVRNYMYNMTHVKFIEVVANYNSFILNSVQLVRIERMARVIH